MAIIGVAFVVARIYQQAAAVDPTRLGLHAYLLLALMAFVYGMSSFLLVAAWRGLLAAFGAETSFRGATYIYGVSQIAKYAPGNIVHLAGRQALGLGEGVPGWPLAKATTWELGLIAGAGVLIGLLALPQLLPSVSAWGAVAAFLVATAATSWVVWSVMGVAHVRAVGWYVGYLLITGLLFLGVTMLVGDTNGQTGHPWLSIMGAYVLAWLAGLLTPGAPAGIGVREAVLLFLLEGAVNEPALLLAVVLGRVTTICGDLLFFCFAYLFPRGNGHRTC